jgi:hypothetical protein
VNQLLDQEFAKFEPSKNLIFHPKPIGRGSPQLKPTSVAQYALCGSNAVGLVCKAGCQATPHRRMHASPLSLSLPRASARMGMQGVNPLSLPPARSRPLISFMKAPPPCHKRPSHWLPPSQSGSAVRVIDSRHRLQSMERLSASILHATVISFKRQSSRYEGALGVARFPCSHTSS